MQNSHAGIIRGLSIATTIISLLCALLFGFLLAGFGLGGIAMNDPNLREQASYSLEVDPADVQSLEDLGIPASDPASTVDWVLGLGSTFLDALTAAYVVVFIASIMGIRNARRADKQNSLLVWAIIGVIASLIGCSPVLLVLTIIVAVLAATGRKAAPVGAHMA